MSENQLTVKTQDLAKRLNENVGHVILSADQMTGFERAFLIARATADLKAMLTDEYMTPIMQLQGSRLGFKTDLDKKGGYPMDVVRNCLIEAVLTGVQPFGNQFNIIAGNCYITKEGFGYLLPRFPGLTDYEIIPGLPRVNPDKTGAAMKASVSWTFNGVQHTKELDIPVKMDQYTSVDSIIGKGTRKARAWLFNRLSGMEIGDGDAADMESGKTTIPVSSPDHETDRIKRMIAAADTIDKLKSLDKYCNTNELADLYTIKMDQLNGKG